jgi:hypothetical protein
MKEQLGEERRGPDLIILLGEEAEEESLEAYA